MPESSVVVPRVISAISPVDFTCESRTSSCTRYASVVTLKDTTGWPATRKVPAPNREAGAVYTATSPGTTSGGGAGQPGSSDSQPLNTKGSKKNPPKFPGLKVSTA